MYIAAHPASRIGRPLDLREARFTGPINLLKFPGLTTPGRMAEDGLPVPIQIVAAPYQNYRLPEIAAVLEERLSLPREEAVFLFAQTG